MTLRVQAEIVEDQRLIVQLSAALATLCGIHAEQYYEHPEAVLVAVLPSERGWNDEIHVGQHIADPATPTPVAYCPSDTCAAAVHLTL